MIKRLVSKIIMSLSFNTILKIEIMLQSQKEEDVREEENDRVRKEIEKEQRKKENDRRKRAERDSHINLLMLEQIKEAEERAEHDRRRSS